MAHLPPSSTAIFSPSVARLAASTAKDWKYVDDWLASKFWGRKPPTFERNPETLKGLLALASLNETADEECQLVARVEAAALRELQAAEHEASSSSRPSDDQDQHRDIASVSPNALKADMLNTLEDSLTREGHTALDAMSSLSVDLGIANPTPELLGNALVHLQSQILELQQLQARVQLLDSHVESETAHIDALLQDLESWRYTPSPDLARQNLDLQRKIKSLAAKLTELEERLGPSLSSSLPAPDPRHTIDHVSRDEAEYLSLLSKKKDLDAQVAQFAGLPDDADAARGQLEQLRERLRTLTRQRDAVFEGLVGRETPRK